MTFSTVPYHRLQYQTHSLPLFHDRNTTEREAPESYRLKRSSNKRVTSNPRPFFLICACLLFLFLSVQHSSRLQTNIFPFFLSFCFFVPLSTHFSNVASCLCSQFLCLLIQPLSLAFPTFPFGHRSLAASLFMLMYLCCSFPFAIDLSWDVCVFCSIILSFVCDYSTSVHFCSLAFGMGIADYESDQQVEAPVCVFSSFCSFPFLLSSDLQIKAELLFDAIMITQKIILVFILNINIRSFLSSTFHFFSPFLLCCNHCSSS